MDLKKLGWPLLGVALVVTGCLLMWYHSSEGGSIYYIVLVLIGLATISLERARPIIELVRGVLPGDRIAKTPEETEEENSKIQEKVEKNPNVLGVDKGPPAPDEWYRVLRPVLHKASYYTTPTYYLNVNLHFTDWNIAFEMLFADSLDSFRNRHVNYFIAALENSDEVFGHARDFTEKVARGALPLVDTEPLVYRSTKYGRMTFLKVATQLLDSNGELRAWAVALLVREIDWGPFERDLRDRLMQDELWSLYSSAYDRVLLGFPPYKKLIEDVTAVLPAGGRSVIDLGAGTGNGTAALLAAGHRVTAVENNVAMLERLRSKKLDGARLTVIKSSLEDLSSLKEAAYDGAVMVNVLYAVNDPLAVLRGIARILKPGGVLGLSTTHAGTLNDLNLAEEAHDSVPALREH
jgi:hypothetical protein